MSKSYIHPMPIRNDSTHQNLFDALKGTCARRGLTESSIFSSRLSSIGHWHIGCAGVFTPILAAQYSPRRHRWLYSILASMPTIPVYIGYSLLKRTDARHAFGEFFADTSFFEQLFDIWFGSCIGAFFATALVLTTFMYTPQKQLFTTPILIGFTFIFCTIVELIIASIYMNNTKTRLYAGHIDFCDAIKLCPIGLSALSGTVRC